MDVVAADRAALNAGIKRAAQEVDDRLKPGPRLRLDAGQALEQHARLILNGLLARAEHNDRVLQRSEDPRELRTGLTGLRLALHLLRRLQHAVHPLRPSGGELGLGTLYFTMELARGLIGPDVDLVESPTDAPRFATLNWPYSEMLNGRETSQDVMPVLLHYPAQEANAALLAPLLIHELGHPAAQKHGLVDEVLARLELDKGWSGVLGDLREVAHAPGESSGLNNVRVLLAGPIEEMVCDAIATACLGPSYLLAFAAWAGLDSAAEWRETDPPTHPPTTLRLGFIVDQLMADAWQLEWASEILAWATGLHTVFDGRNDFDRAMSAGVGLAAPLVREVVNELLGEAFPRLLPSWHEDQVERGLELLFEQGILPAQLDHEGSAADRRCILIAAWKAVVEEHGDAPGSLVAAFEGPVARSNNNFVDKALEMSTLLERWQETA